MMSPSMQKATTIKEWLTLRQRRRYRSGGPRCWGASSDALVFYALGGPAPAEHEYPWDESDWRACENIFSLAPDEIQAKMGPVLEAYRKVLRERGVDV